MRTETKKKERPQGATSLRVLAPKSKLGFGKYEGCTIEEMLDIMGFNEDRSVYICYLAWVYFNMEGISMREDILERLQIDEGRRIAKPGKKPEAFEEWKRHYFDGVFEEKTELQKMGYIQRARKEKRIQDRIWLAKVENASVESKGKMQARNHGRLR